MRQIFFKLGTFVLNLSNQKFPFESVQPSEKFKPQLEFCVKDIWKFKREFLALRSVALENLLLAELEKPIIKADKGGNKTTSNQCFMVLHAHYEKLIQLYSN